MLVSCRLCRGGIRVEGVNVLLLKSKLRIIIQSQWKLPRRPSAVDACVAEAPVSDKRRSLNSLNTYRTSIYLHRLVDRFCGASCCRSSLTQLAAISAAYLLLSIVAHLIVLRRLDKQGFSLTKLNRLLRLRLLALPPLLASALPSYCTTLKMRKEFPSHLDSPQILCQVSDYRLASLRWTRS